MSSEDRVSHSWFHPEPSLMGVPRLAEGPMGAPRAKRYVGMWPVCPAGCGTLWAGCRGVSGVGQAEAGEGAEGLGHSSQASFMALPQAALLHLPDGQNGHSSAKGPTAS